VSRALQLRQSGRIVAALLTILVATGIVSASVLVAAGERLPVLTSSLSR